MRLGVPEALHATNASSSPDHDPREEDARLATLQKNILAVEVLDRSAVEEADMRVASAQVQQDRGRQRVVVIKALSLGVNERPASLRDDGRQAISVAVGERI